MNNDLTQIVMLIDKSGSMSALRNDTIGGFNSFLSDQQKSVDGKANLTLVLFSSAVETVVQSIDVNEVEPLTEKEYRPSGGTALLDAIGKTIDSLEEEYTNQEDKTKIPGKVIFAIITDGEENASTRYTKGKIAGMIKHQTNRHNWEFVFLGANLDAVAEARALGINNGLNFVPSGQSVNDSFSVLSKSSTSYRSSGVADYDLQGTTLEDLNINTKI